MGIPAYGTPTQSTKARQVLHEEAMRVLASSRSKAYESHEFDVPALTNDFSLRDDVDHAVDCTCGRATGAFARLERAHRVIIRNRGIAELRVEFVTDVAAATVGDTAGIEDGESFNFDLLEIEDLKFSNEAAGASRVKVLLA